MSRSSPEYVASSDGAVALGPVNQFDLGLLVLRAVFGLFLAYHGYNKFFGPGGLTGTAGWFGSIGMRWPTLAGPPGRHHRGRRRPAVRRSACSPRWPPPA